MGTLGRSTVVVIGQILSALLQFLLPIAILAWCAYGIFQSAILDSNSLYAVCVATFLGISAIVGGLYPLRRYGYYAYGTALGGFLMLYNASYQAYFLFDLLSSYYLLCIVTIINMWALITAMRFNGWLLAVLGVTIAGMLPTFLLGILTKQELAGYLLFVLFGTLIIAYMMRWRELIVLSLAWYFLYNPILFRLTSLEAKAGVMSIYEVLYVMGAFFMIYTICPLLYVLVSNRQYLFDAWSISLSGAYTFTMSHFIIASHLMKVQDLPFFVKILLDDLPTMADIDTYIFLIYALVYGSLFFLTAFIAVCTHRKITAILTTLLTMGTLSCFGLFYVYADNIDIAGLLVRLHQYIFDLFV